jgi:hypothetical protein
VPGLSREHVTEEHAARPSSCEGRLTSPVAGDAGNAPLLGSSSPARSHRDVGGSVGSQSVPSSVNERLSRSVAPRGRFRPLVSVRPQLSGAPTVHWPPCGACAGIAPFMAGLWAPSALADELVVHAETAVAPVIHAVRAIVIA